MALGNESTDVPLSQHGGDSAAATGTRTPVRLALVGAGLIARQSHMPAALRVSGIEVTAIVDPVVARARELALDFGLECRVGADLSAVIGEVNAALIATPNDTHAPLALKCIDAGIHSLIEKPLASTVAEAEAIVDAAERMGVVVAVGYVTRFRSSTVLLKRLLTAGYFGRVRRFFHQFGTAGGWSPLSAYTLGRASRGGVLVVTGSHFLDRMIHFWGVPDELEYEDDALGGPEANCRIRFVYHKTGLEGWARYSKTFRLPAGLVIDAEAGQVVLADNDDAEVRFFPASQRSLEVVLRDPQDRAPQLDTYCLQLEDFAHAVRLRRPPRVDGRQGLLSMKLIDRIYASRRAMSNPWLRWQA